MNGWWSVSATVGADTISAFKMSEPVCICGKGGCSTLLSAGRTAGISSMPGGVCTSIHHSGRAFYPVGAPYEAAQSEDNPKLSGHWANLGVIFLNLTPTQSQ